MENVLTYSLLTEEETIQDNLRMKDEDEVGDEGLDDESFDEESEEEDDDFSDSDSDEEESY